MGTGGVTLMVHLIRADLVGCTLGGDQRRSVRREADLGRAGSRSAQRSRRAGEWQQAAIGDPEASDRVGSTVVAPGVQDIEQVLPDGEADRQLTL